MIEDEVIFVSPNGRKWTVPADRKCNEWKSDVVCPEDKLSRGVGMSSSEISHFGGICEYGPDQLLACYAVTWKIGEDRSWFTRSDFCKMCAECPHAKQIEDGFDPFYLSMFDAWYLREKFKELIDEISRCPACFVYFISDGQYLKIGKAKNPNRRLLNLQIGNGRKLKLLYLIPTKSEKAAYKIESSLHFMYKDYVLSGEWYDILNKFVHDSFKIFDSERFNLKHEERTDEIA